MSPITGERRKDGPTGLNTVRWLAVGLSSWINGKDSCSATSINWQVYTNIVSLEELTLVGLPRSPPSATLHVWHKDLLVSSFPLPASSLCVYHALHLPAVSAMTDGGNIYYPLCSPVYNQSPNALCSTWLEKRACVHACVWGLRARRASALISPDLCLVNLRLSILQHKHTNVLHEQSSWRTFFFLSEHKKLKQINA